VIYLVCISALAAVTAVFFASARGRFRSFGTPQRVLKVLVMLPLVVSGVAHLIMPVAMAQIIPPVFPARPLLVIVSGIAELTGAAGLLFRPTERTASLSLALLMIAVFPSNIYVAGQTVHGIYMPTVPLRLLMQMMYIALLLAAGWGRPVVRL
jgi:uncharacterized membrane protein